MQNLGGLAKNIYIGDMATAVFSEIANQKNAGRGLFAETTASHVRHNNNFINNYRYTPTYYYLKDKMGKTDSKRYYFGKLSVAPNVDGIGIGYAYTTDIDEHAFNMGFVSSPDFEDFQTQLGELLLSRSRSENYYKTLLKGNSGITSVDQQFIASGITELKRGERYILPEEKDVLNPDKHGDIKSLYKEEQEKIIYNNIARENYKNLNINGREINKWDDAKISYNVDNINKEHHDGLYDYYAYNSPRSVDLSKEIGEFSDVICIENYLSDTKTKDYKSLLGDFLEEYRLPTERNVDNKFWESYGEAKPLFDLYRATRIKTNSYKSSFYRFPALGQQMLYDIGQLNYKVGKKHNSLSNLSLENIKGTLGLNGSYYNEKDIVTNSGTSSETLIILSAVTPNHSSLINKTNQLFKDGKIKSIINRFNTGDGADTYKNDDLVSSYNKSGLSRGRNLPFKNGDASDCRVWTAFKQYSKIKDLIRPFTKEGENSELSFKSIQEIQGKYGQLRPNNGNERLSNNTVLQPNGFVKITPTHSGGTYDGIKNYMFSIENLAWKDIKDGEFSAEQKGPKGGRIMWFPPYNLKFSENVNVNWNGNSFIGRGEQIYTYTNTERSGTLDFTLLIDHPSILNKWRGTGVIDKEKEEKEMELLKYFAGCGNLNFDSSNDEQVGTKPNGEEEDGGKGVEMDEYQKTVNRVILLFFPNAYSCTKNEDETINIEETKNNLETYECSNMIGEFTATTNVNTSSENKQSFLWLNDFNKLSDDGIKYSSTTNIDELITYFPGVDKAGFEEYFTTSNFITLELKSNENGEEKNVEHDEYQANPSAETSPYIYRTSGNTGFTYYYKNGNKTKTEVLNKIKNNFLNLIDGIENVDLYSFKDLIEDTDNKILSYDNATIDSITFGGTATSVGGENVNNSGLAETRKTVIENIFKNHYKEYEGYNSEKLVKVVSTTGTDVNNIEQKLGRIGFIIIKYTITKSFLTSGDAEKEGFKTLSNVIVDNNEELKKELTRIRDVYTYVSDDPYTYDNEFLYFKNLQEKDNFIYKNIVDKVKFFDPAFHSMTPEGFNSRLSFLHQCTRQGPTAKVNNTDFAGNLAFGRAPYCILRIGDFFNTKICIDSMSIQYDNGGGVQWDLNPEGIGVQPMYATVSLNFKFIGGQDISGPIERLQNAVTSNYYANTSIYDPRADYNINKDEISTYIIE